MAFFTTWQAAHIFCVDHDIPFLLNETVFDAAEWGVCVITPL